jgi:hypothetical protein
MATCAIRILQHFEARQSLQDSIQKQFMTLHPKPWDHNECQMQS